MTSIVNDCLDLGKLESGKIEFQHGEFSLSEFLSSLVANNKVLNDLPFAIAGCSLPCRCFFLLSRP
jgi:signal transduction histidine kinase